MTPPASQLQIDYLASPRLATIDRLLRDAIGQLPTYHTAYGRHIVEAHGVLREMAREMAALGPVMRNPLGDIPVDQATWDSQHAQLQDLLVLANGLVQHFGLASAWKDGDPPLTGARVLEMVKERTAAEASAREVLAEVEWVARWPHADCCPVCEAKEEFSHAPDCRLAAALAEPALGGPHDPAVSERERLRPGIERAIEIMREAHMEHGDYGPGDCRRRARDLLARIDASNGGRDDG